MLYCKHLRGKLPQLDLVVNMNQIGHVCPMLHMKNSHMTATVAEIGCVANGLALFHYPLWLTHDESASINQKFQHLQQKVLHHSCNNKTIHLEDVLPAQIPKV